MTQPEKWPEERKAIREGRVLIQWLPSGVAGTYTATASVESLPFPIARVDYRFVGYPEAAIDVLMSTVHPYLKRCGLRTLIHKTMLTAYGQINLIRTDNGTPEGRAWMRATGWKQTDRGWEYRRPRRRK
jgi:hypothetical protein